MELRAVFQRRCNRTRIVARLGLRQLGGAERTVLTRFAIMGGAVLLLSIWLQAPAEWTLARMIATGVGLLAGWLVLEWALSCLNRVALRGDARRLLNLLQRELHATIERE